MTTLYYAFSMGSRGQKTEDSLFLKLPGRISLTIGARFGRAGMDVGDAGFGLIQRNHGLAAVGHPGVFAARHGIFGDVSELAILDQVAERLRSLLLIHGVGVDSGAHGLQVFLEGGFARVLDGAYKAGNRHGDEDADNGHHDHQLDEGKAGLCTISAQMRFLSCSHHVAYLVPSSAVPCDLECTSKTLCPPYESESGSSCMERNPHSAWPVIGSTGILRRTLTFLPCTSTPFTSVSRSGG